MVRHKGSPVGRRAAAPVPPAHLLSFARALRRLLSGMTFGLSSPFAWPPALPHCVTALMMRGFRLMRSLMRSVLVILALKVLLARDFGHLPLLCSLDRAI